MIDFNQAMRLTNISEIDKDIRDRCVLFVKKDCDKKIEMEILELKRLKIKIMIAQSHDWIEDFHLENGYYYNTCYICKKEFQGHKRRVICKECNNANISSLS